MSPGGSSFPNNSVYSKGQDGEWAFDTNLYGKVNLAAIDPSVVLPIDSMVAVSSACIILTAGAATSTTIVAAQGGTTKIQLRGWMISALSTTTRLFEIRFGGTAVANGYIGRGVMNWNMIGHYLLGGNNKALKLYVNGAGTFTATAYWKKG